MAYVHISGVHVSGAANPLCGAPVESVDDPAPLPFLEARYDPLVVRWPLQSREVLVRDFSRLGFVKIP